MTMETKQQYKVEDILHPFAAVFTNASPYYLEQLYHYGNFETQVALQNAADGLRRLLCVPADINTDDILIKVLLLQISPTAAKRHIEVLQAQAALAEAASAISLDGEYTNLLFNYYGSLSSETLFTQEEFLLNDLIVDDNAPAQESAHSKLIDALLDKAQKKADNYGHIRQDNHDYLYALSKNKKISQGTYLELLSNYYKQGSISFEQPYEKLLNKLNAVNADDCLNSILSARIMLYIITEEEALTISKLSSAIGYKLLADDLQQIVLKYSQYKDVNEIAQTFHAILRRMAYVESPVENLGLCVKVITAASEEVLAAAQLQSQEKRSKILYLRELAGDKFFAPYAHELTQQFYPANMVGEVISLFNHILNGLPYSASPSENADIAIKILLKKLPHKDGHMQASFRKENKLQYTTDLLEKEALGLCLGTKGKDEVLSFFRDRLNAYTFWKQDAPRHCYALSILVEELNGKATAQGAALALSLLQEGLPEDSVETLSKDARVQAVSAADVITNYRRFYQAGGDHKDAAQRVINMFQ